MPASESILDALARDRKLQTVWYPTTLWLALLAVVIKTVSQGKRKKYAGILWAFFAGLSSWPVLYGALLVRLGLKYVAKESKSLHETPLPSPLKERVAPPVKLMEAASTKLSITVTLSEEDQKQLASLQALVDSPDWVQIDTKQGTERFQMQLEGSQFNLIKGKTTVSAELEHAHRLMCNYDNFQNLMQVTDVMYLGGRVVQKFDDHHGIFYAAFKLPAFLWSRDFVWKGFNAVLPNREFVLIGKSVEHAEIPVVEKDKLVRGSLNYSGYWVREVAPGKLTIDYLVQADPKGSLPVWVVNFVAKDQADNVIRLRDFLESGSA